MAEWLSSWLAEQEDRGSIPGLATWIFRDWLSPASKSRYGWKIAKSTLILKTTNQPIYKSNAQLRIRYSCGISPKYQWHHNKVYQYAKCIWKIRVCLWNTMPLVTTVWKSYFSTKVQVKGTRSLTLVSFERASLVEYEASISYGSKVIANIKVIDGQTDRREETYSPPGFTIRELISNTTVQHISLPSERLFLSFPPLPSPT